MSSVFKINYIVRDAGTDRVTVAVIGNENTARKYVRKEGGSAIQICVTAGSLGDARACAIAQMANDWANLMVAASGQQVMLNACEFVYTSAYGGSWSRRLIAGEPVKGLPTK